MASFYHVTKGVGIWAGLGGEPQICILADADELKIPATDLHRIIIRARSLTQYASDAEDIARSGCTNKSYIFTGIDLGYIEESIFERSKTNPFLSAKEKAWVQSVWCEYMEKLAKAEFRRVSNKTIRHQVIKRDMGKCRYCGIELGKKEIHIDHVVPYSLGGKTEISNLVTSCKSCNLRKSGRTPEQAGMVLLEEPK